MHRKHDRYTASLMWREKSVSGLLFFSQPHVLFMFLFSKFKSNASIIVYALLLNLVLLFLARIDQFQSRLYIGSDYNIIQCVMTPQSIIVHPNGVDAGILMTRVRKCYLWDFL